MSLNSFKMTPIEGLSGLLVAAAIALLVPVLVLCLECAAAALWRPQRGVAAALADETSLAVLIPAHNEAGGIGRTLSTILPQLRPGDRLVVVADNCTDNTAEVARSAGASVIERFDTRRRGKGYALDFGLNHLSDCPPSVVIFLDADCDALPGGLLALARQAHQSQLPAQAVYLMEKPPEPGLKDSISAFAFKVKNLVRPLGLRQMGQPCLLTGTGMAMPWPAATAVSVASGHIVEDMKLGLDLAIAGYPPQFCPQAWVTSRLPQGEAAAKSQRTRWEHGHLQVMTEFVPKLLAAFLRQGRLGLLALALELLVPPLSLLVMLWVALLGMTAGFALLSGLGLSLLVTGAAGGLLLLSIVLAWQRYGRDEISLQQLAQIPLYLLWKIPLYLGYVVNPEKRWVRTERD